jgi:glycosyltransferase involved in cell wall biosynthesis
MKTLLLDLTTLDTPSRHRGPGRYVKDLACGLMRVPAEVLGPVKLLGLTHLGLDGSYRVTEDLGSFAGSPELALPSAGDHYRWAYARRVALFRAVRRIGAGAVHLGDPNATPLLMGLTRCRKIVTCHDAIPLLFPDQYFGWKDGGPLIGRAIERRRYRSADLVIAISEATRRDAISLLGVPEERLAMVYNGVDVGRWSAAPALDPRTVLERFGLGGRRFVLYVGGMHWHKNVEGMLAGVSSARAHGADVALVWAGRLTPAQADAVRAQASLAGAAGALELIGLVSDDELACLYRTALAHMLVSRSEGFGLTIVEAMASGCPVVTTSAGSLAEVSGDAALQVAPEDHAAIGNAIVRLSGDPELRATLTRRGRERAPRFGLDVQARAIAALYRRVLNG